MTSLEQIIQRYPSESFKKGQTILLKDEIPKAVYVIEKGIIRAYVITPDGVEHTVWLHDKMNDLPIGYAIDQTPAADHYYDAYTSCIVRLVPKKVFQEILSRDVDTAYKQYENQTKRLMKAFDQINALEHPRAGDKVAFMLLHLAGRIGTKVRPSNNRMRLSITQQEIADSLGLTRETTGAELKKLELKHIIEHSRKNYVLYMEKLRTYLKQR